MENVTLPASHSAAIRVLLCGGADTARREWREAVSCDPYLLAGEARNGEEAVALAGRLRPDVILMAHDMPRLSGLEAARRIMSECPAPVVLVSAGGGPDLTEAALAAGVSECLLGPLDPEQLRFSVSLARERYRQALAEAETRAEMREINGRLLMASVRDHELAEASERWIHSLTQQVQQERDVAHALAQSFLGQPPRLPGLEVAHLYQPASEVTRVGGDYFDFIELDPRRLGIVIGDICGKDLTAAISTAAAKYILRGFALEDPSPAAVMARLNRVLYYHMSDDCAFVTLVYGVLDLDTGVFTYTNAGHPPPIVHAGGDAGSRELPPTGGMVGALLEMEYEEESVTLAPGSALILFTDGISEARSAGAIWGHDGIRGVLAAWDGAHPEPLAQAIYEGALAFAGGPLRDDVAIVVVKS